MLDSVSVVIAALKYKSFVSTMRAIIFMGGDTDTIAATSAALLGCLVSPEKILPYDRDIITLAFKKNYLSLLALHLEKKHFNANYVHSLNYNYFYALLKNLPLTLAILCHGIYRLRPQWMYKTK